MLDFIIKYWLQFLFGLAAACFTFGIKRYYKMKDKIKEQEIKEMKENMCTSMKEAVYAKINEEHALSAKEDERIYADLEVVHNNMANLQKGMLSVQGRAFKEDCRKLLRPDHKITIDEYESLVEDHDVYNNLGGNHRGDALFKSVMKKWNHQLNPESYEE